VILFSSVLLSLFITLALIPLFARLASTLHALDFPSERKIHNHPVPRTGGLAMALGTIMPVLLWLHSDQVTRAIFAGSAIVVLLGVADDFKPLGYKAKFVGQFAAALVAVFYGGIVIRNLGTLLPEDFLLPNWFAIPLTIAFIVGMTNAINLADGLDGLAGGISLLSFCCVGYLAYLGGNNTIALFALAVVGAIFAFLRFNTYPATVFMGDAGSQFLGFLAATLTLALTQGNTPLSPILPLILFGFPVLDTLTVMFERFIEGRSPFIADKNHFHHKLLRLGLFHTEAVFLIYVIQSFLVTAAFIFRFYSEWFLLIGYIIFSGLILFGFFIAGRTEWKFRRYDVLDKVIKGRLRILKEKKILIRVSFALMQIGIPSILLLSCFLPASIPRYVSFLSLSLTALIIVTWFSKRKWLEGTLQLAVYLLIPFVIYLGEQNMAGWMNGELTRLYNLSFGFLVLFIILTVKFSKRKSGFQTNPMDFLILFIALLVPNLPDAQIQRYGMGLVAAKIIVLFFGFEVLVRELRGDLKSFALPTVAALAVVAIRGLL